MSHTEDAVHPITRIAVRQVLESYAIPCTMCTSYTAEYVEELDNMSNSPPERCGPPLGRDTGSPSRIQKAGPASQLQESLEAGDFVLTADLLPPKGGGWAGLDSRIGCLRGAVTAVNVADMPSGSAGSESLGGLRSSSLLRDRADSSTDMPGSQCARTSGRSPGRTCPGRPKCPESHG